MTGRTAVGIQSVTKRFGDFVALNNNISLDIQDNEFFTLLGPSGCGKTTLLRTIAGFEEVSAGSILLYGEDIAGLPPNKRPVNTVFQHYALFPHMNVTENVMFGVQRLGKSDQEEALTMSDRIAVIARGELQQVGDAREIYEAPENRFVADFIGETNLIDVTVTDIEHGQARCMLPGNIRFRCPAAAAAKPGSGHLSVRPERVSLTPAVEGLLQGVVTRHIYLGTDRHVEVQLSDGEVVTVRVQNPADNRVPALGESVGLNFGADAARLLVD